MLFSMLKLRPLASYLLMTVFAFHNVCLATTQRASWDVLSELNAGPILLVQCWGDFPFGSTGRIYRWIFNNKTLSENEQLKDADPSRYSVRYFSRTGKGNGNELAIQNALKEDEGYYQCDLEYNNGSQTFAATVNTSIEVASFLPPLNYPECSIEPSTTLTTGNDAIFNCAVGESSPSVDLSLMLVRQDGLLTYLGDTTATKTVTDDDNNTMFICHMTSETFPTGNRTCTAGPITVLQAKTLTTKAFPLTTKTFPLTTNASPLTTTEKRTYLHDSNNTKREIYMSGFIGAIVGVSATLLIFIIIHMIRRHFKFKPSGDNITITTSSGQQPPAPSAMQTYAAYQGSEQEPYAVLNQVQHLSESPNQAYHDSHDYECSIKLHNSS